MKVGVSLWDTIHVDGSDWQVIATTHDYVVASQNLKLLSSVT